MKEPELPKPAASQWLAENLLHELHRLANYYMHNERPGHTLQATALVNEAYIKLCNDGLTINDKQHFFALAAQQMRRILVDHARQKSAQKRGGDCLMVTLNHSMGVVAEQSSDLVYLDELLTQLAKFDPRGAQILELKLFTAMNNSEIANILALSLTTVERDIKAVKAWISSQLHNDSE